MEFCGSYITFSKTRNWNDTIFGITFTVKYGIFLTHDVFILEFHKVTRCKRKIFNVCKTALNEQVRTENLFVILCD